jgi:hypothetical protein
MQQEGATSTRRESYGGRTAQMFKHSAVELKLVCIKTELAQQGACNIIKSRTNSVENPTHSS